MSAEVLVFDILAVIAVIAAAGVVLARNPVHSAVALVVTFVNLAGIFVMLRAEFLAAVQIIVYTGAILVLVLFVIMLVHQDDLPEFHGGFPLQRGLGLIIGLMLLGEFAAAILTRTAVGQTGPWTEDAVERAGGNVQVLGQFLYSGYVLPIQAIAVVLLVGTIGALVLARPDEPPRRARRRTTSTISLAHPRGADATLALPSGVAPAAPRVQPRGEVRGGLVMVKDNQSYTDIPAFDPSFAAGIGEEESDLRDVARGEVLQGRGIGSEEEERWTT
jgi:NADH-quinone oxidoreductase subunit J